MCKHSPNSCKNTNAPLAFHIGNASALLASRGVHNNLMTLLLSHISHILVFIPPACITKLILITGMLVVALFSSYLQPQKSSPRPIVGQTRLILGLTKAPNINFTFFHTSEYYYNAWKNVIIEFGADFKPEIELIVFFNLFKFFSLVHKNINFKAKTSQDSQKTILHW